MQARPQATKQSIRARRRPAMTGGALLALVIHTGCTADSPTATEPSDQPSSTSEPTSASTTEPAATPGPPAAACDPVSAHAVDASDHVDGADLRYTAAPPSYGDHRSRWAVLAPNFYTVRTRPEVAVLVHNLEHGYNVLWYDATVVQDRDLLTRVRRIANSYDGAPRDPDTALIAAPWTSRDGSAFPTGRHYAFTHWYADPTDSTNSRDDEIGYTQYCTRLTGKAVAQWMKNYPLKNSPEGFPGAM